jgi:hypothetical protein
VSKKYKPTKLYCLRKDNLYVAWDGKTLVEKPQDGIRVSQTMAKRKYPGFEMISFVEAYNQWYLTLKESKA